MLKAESVDEADVQIVEGHKEAGAEVVEVPEAKAAEIHLASGSDKGSPSFRLPWWRVAATEESGWWWSFAILALLLSRLMAFCRFRLVLAPGSVVQSCRVQRSIYLLRFLA